MKAKVTKGDNCKKSGNGSIEVVVSFSLQKVPEKAWCFPYVYAMSGLSIKTRFGTQTYPEKNY